MSPRIGSPCRALLLAISLASCGDDSICGELNDGFACDDCPAELARCEFDGVVVTEPSCETCEARVTLYQELRDRGSKATLEEIEAGIVCEVVEGSTAGRSALPAQKLTAGAVEGRTPLHQAQVTGIDPNPKSRASSPSGPRARR